MHRQFVGSFVMLVTVASCSFGSDPVPVGPEFPPRPANVPIAGVDPCAMFTAAQQDRLGLRKATRTDVTVDGQPTASCIWLGRSDIGYGTQTVAVDAGKAATDPSASVIQVNGFGAVRNVVRELTGGAPTCQVTVDAADGQSIRVQAQASRPDRSDGEMCRLATEAASMVMTTVTR